MNVEPSHRLGGATLAPPPRTWLLESPHTGDSTQLRALAPALGWPFEVKRLAYRSYEPLLRLASAATLAGLDGTRSDALAPPYPDLIIGAGRPNEAIAFWIRTRHPNARLVFVGTPWAALDRFDLVIATPQYGLPRRPNVLHIGLPLHDLDEASLAAAGAEWRARLAHLPKPWTAVLVGGGSGPYEFGAAAAARLGREASALGGSLLVSTSARTPTAAADALAAAISVPAEVHRWSKDSAANPYRAFLALADRFVVTADSVSMISEAVSTGKPLFLFDIEEGSRSMRAEETRAGRDRPLPPPALLGATASATAFRLLMRVAPPRFSRDLRIVHRGVVGAGLAAWLGEKEPAPRPPAASADLAIAAARVRGLFGL